MSHDERDDYDDEPWRRPTPPDVLVRQAAGPLWLCGWVFAVAAMGGTALFVIFLLDLTGHLDPAKTEEVLTNLALTGGFIGGCILWAAGLFHGARRMRTFQDYKTAMLAAGMAVLPLPFPHAAALTTFVGVWAVVVLTRPSVRARFAANRRGTIPESP